MFLAGDDSDALSGTPIFKVLHTILPTLITIQPMLLSTKYKYQDMFFVFTRGHMVGQFNQDTIKVLINTFLPGFIMVQPQLGIAGGQVISAPTNA